MLETTKQHYCIDTKYDSSTTVVTNNLVGSSQDNDWLPQRQTVWERGGAVLALTSPHHSVAFLYLSPSKNKTKSYNNSIA